MTLALALPVLALLAGADGAAWKQVAQTDGITVFTRPRQGSQVGEVQATGMIDAPPEAVWKALRDYENYTKNMPYTTEGKVLSRTEGDKVIHFYSVIRAPLVAARDYVIAVVDESQWDEGRGYLKMSWTAVDGQVPPRDGIVRVKVNEGWWRLEPRDGGTRTFATYFLYSDPGGSVPKFVVNHANNTAVPDVFRAIRRTVARAR